MPDVAQDNTKIANDEWLVVFGATSAVGQAVARMHADAKANILLIARDSAKLAIVEQDLLVRGAKAIESISVDLADTSKHTALIEHIYSKCASVKRYYFFYGVLPDQAQCESSTEETLRSLNTNFLSVVSLLTPIANRMENDQKGELVVVSSVAGDRGRQSNYVYGTAKGALSLFLQGLRNRLSKSGCTVLNVKPGFIDTPMTAHLEKGGPLWASAEKVATDIIKAADAGKNEIYTPWFWSLIMLVIKSIPEFIFKQLKL